MIQKIKKEHFIVVGVMAVFVVLTLWMVVDRRNRPPKYKRVTFIETGETLTCEEIKRAHYQDICVTNTGKEITISGTYKIEDI